MEQWSGSQRIAVNGAGIKAETVGTGQSEARPCFFHRDCGGMAEVEKQGKAVCRCCATGLKGIEYPLRAPSREPLYPMPEELVKQLDMGRGKAKRAKQG